MPVWQLGNCRRDRTNGKQRAALRGVTYPDSLPVLVILAKEGVDNMPGWVQRHEDQLSNVRRHEVVVLDGPHYLHWTQSEAMAQMMVDFMGSK